MPLILLPTVGALGVTATSVGYYYCQADEEDSTTPFDQIKIHPSENRGPLRVLFFSAHCGGGHDASAAALTNQFEKEYPGSTFETFNVEDHVDLFPYNQVATHYNKLTSYPIMWKMVYHVGNSMNPIFEQHIYYNLEEYVKAFIVSFDPDVAISVHPAMNHIVCNVTRKISKQYRKRIPFYTVVTDLGSGFDGWFQKKVDGVFLASTQMHDLCLRRGTPKARITLTGLPIRDQFVVVAEKMKSELDYREKVKRTLGMESKPMVLVMGGGEGTGCIEQIVSELYVSFVNEGIDATISVVCAKNEELKHRLDHLDWDKVLENKQRSIVEYLPLICKKQLGANNKKHRTYGKVTINPLGFVKQMADYMAASEFLITKAGPGTIAEAASLGLPVLLTSYLPGQEFGNVTVVLEKGFGEYCDRPIEIGKIATKWMKKPQIYLEPMAERARLFGNADAAKEIVLNIGSHTHAWSNWNKENKSSSQILTLS